MRQGADLDIVRLHRGPDCVGASGVLNWLNGGGCFVVSALEGRVLAGWRYRNDSMGFIFLHCLYIFDFSTLNTITNIGSLVLPILFPLNYCPPLHFYILVFIGNVGMGWT